METNLSEALGEEPPAVETPEVVEEPKAEEAPPEETVEEPAEEPKPKEEPTVPLAVLKEERAKRQEIERRLSAIESPPKPAPDVFEDPEGYTKHMQETQGQALRNERLNMSEDMARLHYGDDVVDQAVEAFGPHMGTAQHQAILDARNPFRALVEWHQQQQALAEIGPDPVKYREALESKLKAEIRAELEAELAVKQVKREAPSLAAEPNLGARSGPAWSGPTSLERALGET